MTNPEYDPFSYELDHDPYPTYRWMRDHAPAYRNERLDFWAFTRFQDNYDAFLDPATYSSSWGTSLEFMDSPKDAMGLATGYRKGASFGKATSGLHFPSPFSGDGSSPFTGGRTYRVAVGFRF